MSAAPGMSVRQRRWVHAACSLLFASGAIWTALHFGAQWRDDDSVRSWLALLLRIHGGAAMLALLVLGAVIQSHAIPALRDACNRIQGLLLLSGAAVLVLTGYALYYSGSDELRALASDVHQLVGLAVAIPFLLHVRHRRRRLAAKCEKMRGVSLTQG